MKRVGEFPVVMRGSVAAAMAVVALTACNPDVLATPVCRTAPLKIGDGTSTALKRVMRLQMLVDAPSQQTGFVQTYQDASRDIRKLRNGAEAQPGDSFIFCNNGTEIYYQANSVQLAD